MKNPLDNEVIDRPSASSTTDGYKRVKSAVIKNVITADDAVNFFEPTSSENANSLQNTITITSSGHVIEIDDTDGAERICIYHKAGHFTEITNDHMVTKIFGKKYDFVLDDNNVYIDGTKNETVGGNVNILVKGNVTQKIDGDYNLKVNGNYNTFVNGKYSLLVNNDLQIETNSNSIFKTAKITQIYTKDNLFMDAKNIYLNQPNSEPYSLKLDYGLKLSTSLTLPSINDQIIAKTLNNSLINIRDTSLTYPQDRTK